MGTIKYIAKTITETAESIKWIATNGNITFNAAGEIIHQSRDKVTYGEYEPIENNDVDFKITFSLNKSYQSVVPLGILDFNNEYENPYFAFDYSLSLNDIDSLQFQITDADGNVIYQLSNLAPVVVIASRVPQINNKIKDLLPAYPSKTFDFGAILDQFSLLPADYTKVGSYVLYWDGFDNNEVYDSTRFNNKTLTAQVTAIKAGKRKNIKLEFSTRYEEVDWVDVKIDRKKNRIDTTLRVNLQDGGAKGLNCWKNTRNFNPLSNKSEICDWDKIPENSIMFYGEQPIKKRTRTFEELRNLALRGINKYWSRKYETTGGVGTIINGEKWEIMTNTLQDINGMTAPEIIFFTNDEETNFTRSRNWELSRKLFYIVGYTYDNDWKTSKESIRYLNKGWYFKKESNADEEFLETSAHEIGHQLLLKYGGHILSKTHKGTSNWSMIIQEPNQDTAYPKNGEIDLMKYADDYYPVDYYQRVIIAPEDLLGLIWLTKIKVGL
ncbi:hypothetical protein ASE74_18400 [Pedobacter sp. Leaf216]|uniref:hypothetical protein n=1 Tax=Pedobacter sp. Leaf216 TaxID=1735684 RepID=UPI0006F59ADA|nr:hypothetical protein [Pedobacter sp. Leaf216]KQM77220.1 hypothetical protein ASE74_18400 [Pedobacter sp. Leaf216]